MEKGQPGDVPLPRAKGADVVPSTIIVALGEEYRSLTLSMNVLLRNTLNKYGHSILSKAFSMSSETVLAKTWARILSSTFSREMGL